MPSPPVLDQDTIDRIDLVAPLFVDAVHCGDAEAIERITDGLDRTSLIALAISVGSLAISIEASEPVLSLVDPYEGWSIPQLREAHASYVGGDRREKTKHGERIYQRMRKRGKASERRQEGRAV